MGDVVRVVKRGRFVGYYIRYIDIDGRRKQRASHQPTKELARRYLLAVEGRVARGIIGIYEQWRSSRHDAKAKAMPEGGSGPTPHATQASPPVPQTSNR